MIARILTAPLGLLRLALGVVCSEHLFWPDMGRAFGGRRWWCRKCREATRAPS